MNSTAHTRQWHRDADAAFGRDFRGYAANASLGS